VGDISSLFSRPFTVVECEKYILQRHKLAKFIVRPGQRPLTGKEIAHCDQYHPHEFSLGFIFWARIAFSP